MRSKILRLLQRAKVAAMYAHALTRASAVVLAAVALLAGSAAAASATTLKLYAKTVSKRAYTPAHKPASSTTIPGPGTYTVITSTVYSGSSSSHSSHPEGTIKSTCTLTQIVSVTDLPTSCVTVLTIGRSSLTVRASINAAMLRRTYTDRIAKGTGAYANATGTWVQTDVSSSATNVVVTYTT
jgi:hypothetical protein